MLNQVVGIVVRPMAGVGLMVMYLKNTSNFIMARIVEVPLTKPKKRSKVNGLALQTTYSDQELLDELKRRLLERWLKL